MRARPSPARCSTSSTACTTATARTRPRAPGSRSTSSTSAVTEGGTAHDGRAASYRWETVPELGGRMRTLIIIPTYLEAENIADVLGQVRAAVPGADILVVDDASPDGTAELARAAGRELGQVDVLVRQSKGGLGGA